jgi:hypothetical protein
MNKLAIAGVTVLIAGAATAYLLWNKPHENMVSAKSEIAIKAVDLYKIYQDDPTKADAQYLDKIIAVSGVVKEISKEVDDVKIIFETTADFSVVCSLDPLTTHPRTNFAIGETITLKGKCTGINLDVQLERCVEPK